MAGIRFSRQFANFKNIGSFHSSVLKKRTIPLSQSKISLCLSFWNNNLKSRTCTSGRVPFLANGDPSLDEELKAKAKHTRCLAEMIGVSAAVECWAGSSGPVDHHGHWPWPLRFLCLFSASPSRSLALLALCCTSSRISGCSEFREIVNRLLVVRGVERVEMFPVALPFMFVNSRKSSNGGLFTISWTLVASDGSFFGLLEQSSTLLTVER